MQKGFTVLELLVVIAIIGILSSIILVSYNGYTDKAKIVKTLQWTSGVNHSLGDRAVGAWTFDNISTSSNTVYDDSGNNNNGTIYNGAVQVDGIVGKAMQFDGVDDHIAGSGQGIKGIANGTIQFWAKPLGRGYFVGNNAEGKVLVSNYAPLIYGVQSVSIFWSGASIPYPGGISLSDNIWTHIVITWSNAGTGQANGEIKWYSNGILKKNVSGLILPVGTSNSFDIGEYGGASPFNGLIDDVRIYSAALTQVQIQQHYADDLKTHQNLAVSKIK